MKRTLTVSWWQFAGAILLMIGWIAGDYILLLNLDAAILDSLPGDSRSSRASAFEPIVCHPLPARERPARLAGDRMVLGANHRLLAVVARAVVK